MLKPKRRRVVSAKPSRNACRTCRIRKVKCDETKPGCKRCSSTGRKCDGYPVTASTSPPETIAAQRKLLPAFGPCTYPVSMSLPAAVAIEIPISDHEKFAYEWFIRESASVLWHISPAKKWIRLALQLATREETVFYAATAVATTHRAQTNTYHHTLRQPTSPEKNSGLTQYCKAAASLQRYINRAISSGFPFEPVVLCCLLFVVFEVFQENGHQALSHLRWCKALVQRVDADTATQRDQPLQLSIEIRHELLVMFKRLEAEIDVASRTLHFPTDPRMHCSAPRSTAQTAFTSAEIAKECLCNIMEASARFREDLVKRASVYVTPAAKVLRDAVKYCIAHCLSRTVDLRHDKQLWHWEKELKQAHEDWLRLFTEMTSRSTATASATITLMEIQHVLSRRTLHASLVTREDLLDQYEIEDSRTLDLVERYFTQSASLHPVSPPPIEDTIIGPEPQKSFSLDDGILPTLYLICLKCRSSSIRHRAWRILRNADRREGLHYSRALADRAQDIIQLEENRAKDILGVVSLDGCRIPEAARLSDVVVESVSPFESRVICGRFQHENRGELEVLEYRRFREPFVHPDPIWQIVLKNRDRDG